MPKTRSGPCYQIRKQIDEATSDYDREAAERVAKLAGGVALIKVGAATEVEMEGKKARVEDALHATRRREEGIVAGGGVACCAPPVRRPIKGDNHDRTPASIVG